MRNPKLKGLRFVRTMDFDGEKQFVFERRNGKQISLNGHDIQRRKHAETRYARSRKVKKMELSDARRAKRDLVKAYAMMPLIDVTLTSAVPMST